MQNDKNFIVHAHFMKLKRNSVFQFYNFNTIIMLNNFRPYFIVYIYVLLYILFYLYFNKILNFINVKQKLCET